VSEMNPSPATVVMSDLPEVLPLLRANILLNDTLAMRAGTSRAERCLAVPYTWGDNVDALFPSSVRPRRLLVLGSDVVYDPAGYEPLYRSIKNLLQLEGRTRSGEGDDDVEASMEEVQVLLAHRHRHPHDQQFFDMLLADDSLVMVEEETRVDWKSHVFPEEGEDGVKKKNGETLLLSDIRLLSIRNRK